MCVLFLEGLDKQNPPQGFCSPSAPHQHPVRPLWWELSSEQGS